MVSAAIGIVRQRDQRVVLQPKAAGEALKRGARVQVRYSCWRCGKRAGQLWSERLLTTCRSRVIGVRVYGARSLAQVHHVRQALRVTIGT